MNLFLKLLKAKQRNEIRGGKLWEITRICGIDVFTSEKEPAKPEPRQKMAEGKVDAMRTHVIKVENNETNMTKDADFL